MHRKGRLRRRQELGFFLTSRQNATDFANDWLVTAQIRGAIEHEAKIEPEVVSLILGPQDRHGKSNDTMVTRGTDDETATEWIGRYHILGDVIEVKENPIRGWMRGR